MYGRTRNQSNTMSREAQFMARFVKKRRSSSQDENVSLSHEQNDAPSHEPDGRSDASRHEQNSSLDIGNSSQAREEINWEEEIKFDPGKRRCIDESS